MYDNYIFLGVPPPRFARRGRVLRGFSACMLRILRTVRASRVRPYTRLRLRASRARAEGAQARGIVADVLPFPEGDGGTGADSPTARSAGSPKLPSPLTLATRTQER
jgi:hypothetical protein